MTTKWVNRFVPLYVDHHLRVKHCDIPAKTLVHATGNIHRVYEEVVYVTSTKTYTGWVHMDDLEDYVRNFATNVVEIENKTLDPRDFEQYIQYNSVKQVNMCGQLCVANVLGISLNHLLSKWEQKNKPFWRRLFSSGQARGTGQEELQELCSLFGIKSNLLSVQLYQNHIGRARYTIKNLNSLLGKGSIIMSVHINKNSGFISSSGILHWIVLKTLLSERNGQGFTTFYNPAMNSIESCSWNELMVSAGVPYGIYVQHQSTGGLDWNENRD